MAEWIKFVEVNLRDGRKTRVWAVLTIDGCKCLGRIGWYGPWRKYSFIPVASDGKHLIFEEDCLQRITDFCRAENIKHREIKKAQKLKLERTAAQ
jgi:hypothetical protein